MEIERKFLIKSLPDNLESYSCDTLIQAYISTEPVIRVRKKNEDYILTLKSAGLLAREEIEMPLTEESFKHLLSKKDGISIKKKRYKIPDTPYLIELDVFEGRLQWILHGRSRISGYRQCQCLQCSCLVRPGSYNGFPFS